jgi:pyruvate formate lyase activating enzyme
MKEALLAKKLTNKKVQCGVCHHHCIILPDQRGLCGVRKNQNGQLYSLVYGKACAVNIDPIEKKPFFHFLPGSYSLSVATVGCNFRCLNCQNWDISQGPKPDKPILGQDWPPDRIVQEALNSNCPSLSYTYTEPSIFLEYALDTMKLAKRNGLKNNWVTNGFMSPEILDLIAPYLDAANIDLKSFSDNFYQEICGARLQPVLDNLKLIKKKGIWLEVTTLVIPTLNDKEETFQKIAQFIKEELGPETPWHISQFSPEISWQLQHLSPTPAKTIEKACQIGLETGLKYVYSGNIPGLASEDTYCPKCHSLMIDRQGYSIQRFDDQGRCSKCGENLDLI